MQTLAGTKYKVATDISKYSGITRDDSNKGQYLKAGKYTTIVPVSNEFGGVDGGNKYGEIVDGEKLRFDEQQERWVPTGVNKFEVDEDSYLTKISNEELQEASLAEEKVILESQLEDIIQNRNKTQATLEAQRKRLQTPVFVTGLSIAQTPVEKPISYIKAALKGKFGTYRSNKYIKYIDNESFVILVASGENSFEPPKDYENYITIEVAEQTYKVLYIGISFEEENKIYQVYIKIPKKVE